MKSQRTLARGAQNNLPDDMTVLNYYLYVSLMIVYFLVAFTFIKGAIVM